MHWLMKINTFMIVFALFAVVIKNSMADTPVTIYTPEGCPVNDTYIMSDGTPWFTDAQALWWIDYLGLDAEIIETATAYYNCHGYAWMKSENRGTYWVGYYGNNPELLFFNDEDYSNDSQASYISESPATHGCYEPYSDHSIRVIQNNYPISSSGQRTHVSKWGSGPLVRHAPGHDIFAEKNTEIISYYKLKTTHYGSLYNYPKTWIGAGSKTHTITNNLTTPSGSQLTIKSGSTVQFYTGKNMTVPFSLISETNLTIPSSSTLTINSGADIEFVSGTSLSINGTLTAIGTSNNNISFDFSSKNQNGIKFYSGSGGTLSYCTIENAHYGVYCSSYLPTIQYCTISDNNYGIFLNNTGGQSNEIKNNIINGNTYDGIFMNGSSAYKILENTISNNGECGIYCTSGSAPRIWENVITGNGWAGVYCIDNSPARFGDQNRNDGYNLITGNGNGGVTAGYESDIILGGDDGAALNSIHDNTNYEVTAGYDSHLLAENNWWNRPTYPYYSSGDFNIFVNSSVDYNPALSYDPVGGMMKTASNSQPQYGETSLDNLIIDSELREALSMLLKGDFEDAISMYEKRIDDETGNSKKKYILRRIAECYELSEKEGFVDYLNNKVRHSTKGDLSQYDELYATTLDLESIFLIGEKKYNQAVKNFETLTKDFSDIEAITKPALFNLVYLHYLELNDFEKGKEYLLELKSLFPDDYLTFRAMLLAGEIDNISSPKTEKGITTEKEIPDKFSLLDNYPNPFNPITIISYSLPVDRFVSLKVYDILGREVAELVNEEKQAGNYSINFNGANLSSGIYFYSIKMDNYQQVRKMVLMK